MLKFIRKLISRPSKGVLCTLVRENNPVTCQEVFQLLATNDDFVEQWRDNLLECSSLMNSAGYFFECCCFRPSSSSKEPFRMVLLNSPQLARTTIGDWRPFAEQLKEARKRGELVAAFANLSGNATLVAPIPLSNEKFAHLALFALFAPDEQQIALWKTAAEVVLSTKKDCWLSTSGLAVHWTHLRIDESPKYYSYLPFR